MKVEPHIIRRYLDGTGKKDDKEKIISWFSGSQTVTELRQGYKNYWNEMTDSLEVEGYNEEKILGRIYHQIKIEESKFPEKPAQRKYTQRVITIFTKVAALLFIPLTIFILLNKDHLVSTDSDVAWSEIYAPMGTRAKFSLPDGSTGYLNAGSSIRVPNVFKGKSREIALTGEAYFDVISNPHKPFVVSGKNIRVVALGTSFNVEAYPEDQINKVTLVKGKVEVFGEKNNKSKSLGLLSPGEMCVFNSTQSSSEFVRVDASKIISWKDGKLVFINEPFPEVVKKLNRRYSVNIVIEDERLNNYSYLATFEDETLEETFNLLKLSAPIEIREHEREKKPDGSYGEKKIEFYFKN
ncbi:MAG: hypothetical protein A2W90_17780 [Bacteroidetes bacterium GWF2_42_66]|nr:MAG: hypothetical protein A2W92_13050 [Bacteroidetes bacterium GWA2_42_15]OFX98105.1 MAG: hypothetical protein A2W89_09270 [Bacteroidetes bacterium GWE2_42_39]OFY42489.1 MAG: hypothetical protein A2W90_17780 [Bacteroidetes bacterium GWF2_42_66]HAZ03799.1 hypothetical protein [Marinilabiliales bacterium]HBL74203.1 hypothetical protein [Prolixibacteraceae bacterium]